MQVGRREKVEQSLKDQDVVKSSGGLRAPASSKLLLITEHGEPEPARKGGEGTKIQEDKNEEEEAKTQAAHDRERDRQEARMQRDQEREERLRRQRKATELGSVDWFWVSQIDALPGYCATPWKSEYSRFECLGAITVALEGLKGFVSPSFLDYKQQTAISEDLQRWMNSGKKNFPGLW